MKTVLLLLGEACCSQPLAAAAPGGSVPPLYRFFQQHFDSTVVFQQHSARHPGPDLLILSKRNQEVYFFTYRSPYKSAQGRYVPGGLPHQFGRLESRFRATPPDTNQYLLLPLIPPVKLKQTWKSLHMSQLWQVRDMDARSTDTPCIIEDAETVTLWFMTRSSIRKAGFYAPVYHEQCEGSGANRRQVIKTRTELEELLKL